MQNFKTFHPLMLAAGLASAATYSQEVTGEAAASGSGTAEKPAEKTDDKKKVIIKADQPAAPTAYVNMVPQIFHFKTEKLRNEKGEEVGTGKKHPSVEIYLPVPTTARLIEMLSDPEKFPKEVELLQSAVIDQIYGVARGQINELREKSKDTQINPSSLNYEKLDWTAIANMPKSERGAWAPSEEDLKSFFDSYLEVMPKAAGKSKEKIENHILCFKTGFKKQRAQKDILEMFQSALQIYIANAGEQAVEDNAEVIEYFSNKLDRMVKSEEKITMDDL